VLSVSNGGGAVWRFEIGLGLSSHMGLDLLWGISPCHYYKNIKSGMSWVMDSVSVSVSLLDSIPELNS
jgi:hypothetical protein